jgi:preprotein translocase subunit SecG
VTWRWSSATTALEVDASGAVLASGAFYTEVGANGGAAAVAWDAKIAPSMTVRAASFAVRRGKDFFMQSRSTAERRGSAQRCVASRTNEWPAIPSTAMSTILGVLQVFLCVVLVFLILMHSGKDAGLSGAFGVGTGAGPFGGGSLVERNLNRWTIGFAIAFVVNTIILIKIS